MRSNIYLPVNQTAATNYIDYFSHSKEHFHLTQCVLETKFKHPDCPRKEGRNG